MTIKDPIEEAVAALVELGIATPAKLKPLVDAWHRQRLSETIGEEDELTGFIKSLHASKILNMRQGKALLSTLQGSEGYQGEETLRGRNFGGYITAETRLHQGSESQVLLATRVDTLEGPFALKALTALEDPRARARFERAAGVQTQLKHPNVIGGLASGESGGTPYLVMEHVKGPKLTRVIQERAPFQWDLATRVLRMLASAIEALHAAGWVHRDLQPENVLVTRQGVAKLGGFGRLQKIGAPSGDPSGTLVGVPGHMAPEQWRGPDVDARADLFALGVIYYQLLTGVSPFGDDASDAIRTRTQAGQYTQARRRIEGLPQPVDELVAYMLEPSLTFRVPSAKALLEDLDRVMQGAGPDVPRLVIQGDQGPRVRFPLLGRASFDVGSGDGCAMRLRHASIEPLHARLERGEGGIVLRARGSVLVNGAAAREHSLRDQDVVQFGGIPPLQFLAGRGGRSSEPPREVVRPRAEVATPTPQPEVAQNVAEPAAVSGLLLMALQDVGHPRAFMALLEDLVEGVAEHQVFGSSKLLYKVGKLDQAKSRQVRARAKDAWKQRAERVASTLARMTREELGTQPEPWLARWMAHRGRLPRQFRLMGPRVRGRAITYDQEGKPTETKLEAGELWTVGRGREVDIFVPHRSVSREHLRLYRLATRFAFQDPGSRFGVTLNKKRTTLGLLKGGEELLLGKGRVRVETSLVAQGPEEQVTGLDRDTFEVLVTSKAPHVLAALVAFMDGDALVGRLLEEAARHEAQAKLEPALRSWGGRWRQRAHETLSALAPSDLGPEPGPWRSWLASQREKLPPQLGLLGWEPPALG